MIATITLHVMAALLLGLTLLFAVNTGLAYGEGDRKNSRAWGAITLAAAIITFAVQVIA